MERGAAVASFVEFVPSIFFVSLGQGVFNPGEIAIEVSTMFNTIDGEASLTHRGEDVAADRAPIPRFFELLLRVLGVSVQDSLDRASKTNFGRWE